MENKNCEKYENSNEINTYNEIGALVRARDHLTSKRA